MDSTNMTAREKFLALAPEGFPEHEEVSVPGFGALKIKVLTAGEKDAFEMSHVDKHKVDFRARLVAATAIDDRGAKVFQDADVTLLTELPAHVLDPVVKVALRVNRLTEEDQAELQKN